MSAQRRQVCDSDKDSGSDRNRSLRERPSLFRLRQSIEPEARKGRVTPNKTTTTSSTKPTTKAKKSSSSTISGTSSTASSRSATQTISLRPPPSSISSSGNHHQPSKLLPSPHPHAHPASRTTPLPKNSLASPKPRLVASAIFSDGRSRHSIAPSPSSAIGTTTASHRRPRPVTAAATIISSSSSTTRLTLAKTLSTIPTNPNSTARPPSSLSSISSTTNASAVSLRIPARNATPTIKHSSNHNSSNNNTSNTNPTTTTTTTTAATTSTATTTTAFLRAPLFRKDQNVHSGGMTRQQKTFTATMAPDRASAFNHRQPPLATSAVKGVNRTPLTPKIAASTAPRVAQSGATTPLARRPQQQQQQQTGGVHQTSSGNNASLRDEYASPVSAFLSSNITPRSGTRQNRVDSVHNSPCGTPNPDRDSWDSRSGLGIAGIENESAPRRPLAFSPANDTNHHGHGHDAQATADSKFFYASDAKGSTQPKPPAQPARSGGPTFFYANGGLVENRTTTQSPSPSFAPTLGHIHSPEPRPSKFIYANGVPDLPPSHSQTASPRPSSVVSTTARMTPGRLNHAAVQQPAVQSHAVHAPIPRPASPVKMASQPSLSAYRAPVQSSTPTPTRTPVANHTTAAPSPTVTARRVSFENAHGHGHRHIRGHSRSGSLANIAIESPPSVKGLSSPQSEVSTPVSLASPIMAVPQPLKLQPVTERVPPSENDSKAEVPMYSELHSPTKAGHSADQLNELITNARRERKVQDLEITNASLAAINRSLERRLRRQTAELRRYRRLSRSGRLSLASAADSVASEGPVPEPAMAAMSLADLSEEESEESEEEDESDLSETDSGSDSLSPEARAARDARHRQRDERRLQLDLTKHRELLVDSQKINQSLRKCLNWTEELIQEGRKALAYQVRVSDIKLGGRILVAEDEDEEDGIDETDGGDDDGDDEFDNVTLDPDDQEDTLTIHGARFGRESDGSMSSKDDLLEDDSGVELHGGGI